MEVFQTSETRKLKNGIDLNKALKILKITGWLFFHFINAHRHFDYVLPEKVNLSLALTAGQGVGKNSLAGAKTFESKSERLLTYHRNDLQPNNGCRLLFKIVIGPRFNFPLESIEPLNKFFNDWAAFIQHVKNHLYQRANQSLCKWRQGRHVPSAVFAQEYFSANQKFFVK